MNNLSIYEQDFYAWIDHHIELLRQRRFSELELDILIDELESMAKRDKRELVSHFIILVAHLLKWPFQFEQLAESLQKWQGSSWRGSITEQRIQIAKQLQESPSLKSYLVKAVEEAYPDAVKIAENETGLSEFPKYCPYSIEQLLDLAFYPNTVANK